MCGCLCIPVLLAGYVLPPVDGGIISTLFWAIAMTGCGCQWYFACSCSFVGAWQRLVLQRMLAPARVRWLSVATAS